MSGVFVPEKRDPVAPDAPWYLWNQSEYDLFKKARDSDHEDDRRQAALLLGHANPNFYVHSFLKIRDEDKGLQTFNRHNRGQVKIWQAIASQYYKNQPVRVLVGKPRQIGSTTYLGALDYAISATRYRSNGLLLAHEENITKRIFRICRRYHENVPDWVRPSTLHTSRAELVFNDKEGNGLDSSLFIDTAGRSAEVASKVGRGDTLGLVHLSEFDHYKHQDELLLSLTQGIPDLPDTFAWYESTANGVGNFMDKFWEEAVEGVNGFVPVFLYWADVPYRPRADGTMVRKYSRDLPIPADEFKKTLTTEEYEMAVEHQLTLEQIEWRRFTIRTKCRNNPQLFDQEYPITPEVMFISSGERVFSHSSLLYYEQIAKDVEPSAVGEIKETNEGTIFIQEKSGGPLELFHYPDDTHEYIVSWDPAGGYESGDFTSIDVFDRNTQTFVANYYAKADVPTAALVVCLLGQYYCGIQEEALVIPDATAVGMAAVWALKRLGYRRIYARRDHTQQKAISAQSVNNRTRRLGYHIGTLSRPILIDDIRTAVNECEFMQYSRHFTREARRFMILDGKETHAKNAHDDKIFSYALALRAHKEHGQAKYKEITQDRGMKVLQAALNQKLAMMAEGGGVFDIGELTGEDY